MHRFILLLRSCLFTLVMLVFTPICATVSMLTMPLPYRLRYYITVRWNAGTVWLAKVICGIRYQVKGMENLPETSAIVLSKHQSAWETIFLMYLLPRPLAFVLKKELLSIPFFGWALALLKMIPINRKLGMRAFHHVISEGKQRLADGMWIIMFPEGTRTPVGKKGEYKGGGTRLALATDTVIVPIALNSGECWPKNSFIKKPGLITVSIGAPISPHGLTHEKLMKQVEDWIEGEMRVISPHAYPSQQAGKQTD